jgi:hypothetical protein
MAGEEDPIGQLGKHLDARYAQVARAVHRFGASRTKRQPVVEVSPTVLGDWGVWLSQWQYLQPLVLAFLALRRRLR